MAAENINAMQCNEFEALLSDALDQKLTADKQESFRAHAKTCAVCGPLLQEAEAGQRWLKSLADVAPPQHLVQNILVATSGLQTNRFNAVRPVRSSWLERLRDAVAPVVSLVRQPRFAMSFGMAFFTLSVSLGMAGIKMTDLRSLDLRPSTIKRTYYETSGRVVKYYENIRFVYEIESRMRELKQMTAPVEAAPEEKPRGPKNSSGDQSQPKQERNYSRGEHEPVFAAAPNDLPVVTRSTHRRLS